MNDRGIWAWNLVKVVTGGSLVIFIFIFIACGLDEAGLRQNIRWSARISFSLFCLAFSASAIHAIVKSSATWWLLMNRKYLGISFALVHLIHLVFIILLQINFHPVFNLAANTSLVGGGIAYFFVVAMLVTSFESFESRLTRLHWKTLHTVGGYWIWSIFMTSYYKRALTEPWHGILVAILVGVIGLRLFKFWTATYYRQ